MKNSNKKGFTIVELVIVIAVIAILAAVLIPTFSNITEKSRVASDMTMIRNINTGLQADEALHGKPGTMHEALEIALNTGYKLENIEPISESEVIYDSKNNRFALIDKNGKLVFGEDSTKAITDTENSADKHLLWKIAKADADVDTILNAGYSVYLANTEISGRAIALSGLGFDVGDNANAFTVAYNGAGYETVIRTNIASTLTIDAANDTVKHYGAVDTLTITAIASNSYHEFGFVKTVVDMGSGRFVAEGTAKFHQKKDEISFGSMTFEEKSGVIYGEHLSIIDGKYTCCGVDANEHDHAWELDSENSSPAKCVETGVNVYKCTVDGCEANKVETLPALGHIWDEGVITTQPTEKNEGVKTFTCTRCSETKTEGVPATGHAHNLKERVAAKAATCTEAGNKEYYTCTGCSLKFEDAELKKELKEEVTIQALGHDWSEFEITKNATCQVQGEKTKHCKRDGCSEKQTEYTGYASHTENNGEITQAPTCEVAGVKTYKCTVCGEVTKVESIDATGHTWGTPVTTAATCGKDGKTVKTCTTCKKADTTIIPATGKHEYGEWTKTDDKHIRTCKNCGHADEGEHDLNADNKCTVCDFAKPVAGVKTVDELTAAIKAANAGDTITLGANITATSAITISKEITIDLNGYVLSSTAKNTLVLKTNANVTVIDNSEYQTGKITNGHTGNSDPTTIDLYSAGAIFTLKSGEVESNIKDDLYTITIGNSQKKTCTVNIEGGIVSNPRGTNKNRVIKASSGMTVNINGGEIYGGLYALDVFAGSVSNIFGGKLEAYSEDGRIDEYGTTYAIHAYGTATITIGSTADKYSNSRPEVKGIIFEATSVVTELPTIKLVKGDITNPFYSKEAEYNYGIFANNNFIIEADADVTFSLIDAGLLPDTLELYQDGNVWRVRAKTTA